MVEITFEGRVPCGPYEVLTCFTIAATNKEDLMKSATERANDLGIKEFLAVGLHNKRADWEKLFGPSDPEDTFGDDHER